MVTLSVVPTNILDQTNLIVCISQIHVLVHLQTILYCEIVLINYLLTILYFLLLLYIPYVSSIYKIICDTLDLPTFSCNLCKVYDNINLVSTWDHSVLAK